MRRSPPVRRVQSGIALIRAVLTAPVDDGMTLIDSRRGTVYHLNRTGAVILAGLVDGGTVESAAATLVDRYGVEQARARADVTVLVGQLRARGLVTSR